MKILARPKTLFLLIMALLLLCGTVHANSFILDANLLKVGVSSSGALVNDADTQGITYKPSAFANDFTQPGIPWEFYSIGVNGVWQSAGYDGTLSAGAYVDHNAFNLTTNDVSSPGTKYALSSDGIIPINGVNITYTQNVYFDLNSNTIHFGVDIGNTTGSAIDVVYARGLDPDPDELAFGVWKTLNWISGNSVSAVGTNTGLPISIIDLTNTGFGVAAISGPSGGTWDTNPYDILGGGLINGAVNAYDDYSINMAWAFTLDPHTSYQIDFAYQIPLPPTVLLLGTGLLGLVGLRYRSRRKS
jgi:hypothetical protein